MVSTKKESLADKPLTSVMEDYLEAIFDLDREKKVVRVKDIAKRLDVKMPTVSSMLKTLKSRGLVSYEKYEYVELTKDGADIGKEMRRRHGVLFKFLTEILKIKSKVADEEACKMEHTLSEGTLASLTDFMEFIQTCPRAGESWLEHFEEYRRHGHKPEKCIERCDVFSIPLKEKVDAIKNRSSRGPKK
ncbi:metal-dependent transcriptional regulator [Desulfatitalea tepidiphila]|uniref:metal-dependent transcriptional regulator n=1 Tax=Desulfatitalea tepidiphila TaxID=1185843 RepID=UPI0006B5ACBB|nr:metal-dependent transcriptional regulator [Desulfatitalea tepidiphila]